MFAFGLFASALASVAVRSMWRFANRNWRNSFDEWPRDWELSAVNWKRWMRDAEGRRGCGESSIHSMISHANTHTHTNSHTHTNTPGGKNAEPSKTQTSKNAENINQQSRTSNQIKRKHAFWMIAFAQRTPNETTRLQFVHSVEWEMRLSALAVQRSAREPNRI